MTDIEAVELAERSFASALMIANMCPLPKQEWFRDAKRHLVRQNADAICRAVAELQAENQRLRAALKPFVDRLANADHNYLGNGLIAVPIGDCRRALELLK